MTKAAQKIRARRARKPIYLRCARLVDEATGEMHKGWLAMTVWDARLMQQRGYGIGTEVQADFKKPRNIGFHRLSHALAGLMVEQIDDFHGMTYHDALKRLQVESGALCEVVEMDAGPVIEAVIAALAAIGISDAECKRVAGTLTALETIPVKRARSMSFDEMEEGDFNEGMKIIFRYISSTYWKSMDEWAVEEAVRMFEREQSA